MKPTSFKVRNLDGTAWAWRTLSSRGKRIQDRLRWLEAVEGWDEILVRGAWFSLAFVYESDNPFLVLKGRE